MIRSKEGEKGEDDEGEGEAMSLARDIWALHLGRREDGHHHLQLHPQLLPPHGLQAHTQWVRVVSSRVWNNFLDKNYLWFKELNAIFSRLAFPPMFLLSFFFSDSQWMRWKIYWASDQFHLQVDVSWKFSTFFVVTYQPWLEDIKEIIEGRVRVQGANSVFSAVSRISSRWSSSTEKLLQKASFEDFKRW